MIIRFMVVFDLLFNLFRTALWPSVGKEHLCCFYFNAVLIVGIPFPCGVWGRMWNSIVPVPDRCIFIFFAR